MSVQGFAFLRKEAGQTSFRALGPLKRILNTSKIGHTGTLDRFAEGLLIACVGKMTKFSPYLTRQDKCYEATFKMGEETDTLDPEGAVTETGTIPSLEEIKKRLPDFESEALPQKPPAYSAVHIGGKRAYRMARKGDVFDIPERIVKIYRIQYRGWEAPFLRLRIRCSSGTYIRSLARDLGRACGTFAHVTRLNRTEIGPFSLEEASLVESFAPEALQSVFPVISRLPRPESRILPARLSEIFQKTGQFPWEEFRPSLEPGKHYAFFDEQHHFSALVDCEASPFKIRVRNFAPDPEPVQ